MGKVREKVLETMLKDYKPLYRFLKQANYDQLKSSGIFQVPLNWFYDGSGEFGHFTDVERIFCFNQLSYVLLAEAFEKGHVPNVPAIPLEDFYKLQKSGSYIVESNNIKYKKPIVSSSPFKGTVEVKETFLKSKGGIAFFDISYDFEDGRATGEVRCAIILKDLQIGIKNKAQ
jgi:hypothetical protein